MSCENKLTNLVFKNKENSARIQLLETKEKTQNPKKKEQWSQREKQ